MRIALVIFLILFLVIFAFFLLTILRMKKVQTYKFPKDFKIGAATSSYQIEGAWNLDGKSPNIWDTMLHSHPELIIDRSNSDVGLDSYHFYKEDVKAAKNAGMEIYRFSISWARILPNQDDVNDAGLQYYSNLIDELISNGIEPLVTIYHWDLPQYIQDLGGFQDPIIVSFYEKYVTVLFENFGSRVKRWITFNEPYMFCVHGYSSGIWAPQIKAPGTGEYLCGHHVLQAHAAAYKIYNEQFRPTQNGEIGISLVSNFFYPDENVDPKLAEKMQQFQLGWFAHPIFSETGDYPQIMIDEISRNSKNEGRQISRLPLMSEEMKKSLIGSSDFLALNYYTSSIVSPLLKKPEITTVIDEIDIGVVLKSDKNWKRAKSVWLYVVPQGLHDLLKWIKQEYKNPTVLISENGYSDDGNLNDYDRIDYIKGHLAAVSKAINEDKCKVVGYTIWTLLDGFEWMMGYTEKFGIYAVNMDDPTKERIAKKSVNFFKDFTKTRKFDY